MEHKATNTSNGSEQYFASTPSSEDVRLRLTIHTREHEFNVTTSHGVFSMHRLDLGTSVLLRQAPQAGNSGNMLDLGCGWGPVSLTLAAENPDATVWALDVNERALDLTRDNAKANGLDNIRPVLADQIPADMQFDCIWSNPPIRVGKEILHELLMTWLPRLKPQGSAYLVVQKNLGADSLIPWLVQALGEEFSVSKYASSKGYRVIEVLRKA
ncbi:class I SAM-dependent methyltransferase [Bifidobacterium tsurumiense]|uniref:Methyltransferase domain n=1 Tax=Bifidobacterium tsurumiense TaxID=356829 RepID=A0A087EJU6_9BIFI|nr:methyltransferase [Bifidobacterium tsurumiense]KFJ08047.1 methyltransferase domain [Bifidobacterium tsurumiense]